MLLLGLGILTSDSKVRGGARPHSYIHVVIKIKRMDKINELKAVVGKDVSENRSPTLRAKLVKVNKSNCIFESVQSPYKSYPQSEVGVRYKVPTAFAWNAYFF